MAWTTELTGGGRLKNKQRLGEARLQLAAASGGAVHQDAGEDWWIGGNGPVATVSPRSDAPKRGGDDDQRRDDARSGTAARGEAATTTRGE
ncbi:hypothetical protein Scep_019626 [Stephania cephalantha]|uniref:Uncharacterized protein n=1 Tax=Stephania cephalantha TaxID=152367 RepID=A0AAP0IBD3_9MAGN